MSNAISQYSIAKCEEILEKLLLDANGNRKPTLAFLDTDASSPEEGFDGAQAPNSNGPQQSSRSQTESQAGISSQMNSSSKRRRTTDSSEVLNGRVESGFDDSLFPPLPHPALLQAIVEEHFSKVHHWIPILHQSIFKAKLRDPGDKSKLSVLLHALVSASIKYVNIEEYGISLTEMHRQIRVSRNVVGLNAMEIPSVENLQALVILAFDLVCCPIFNILLNLIVSHRWVQARSLKPGQLLDR